jgi:hypothetical protein
MALPFLSPVLRPSRAEAQDLKMERTDVWRIELAQRLRNPTRSQQRRKPQQKKPTRVTATASCCLAAKRKNGFARYLLSNREEVFRPWQAWQRPTLPSLVT